MEKRKSRKILKIGAFKSDKGDKIYHNFDVVEAESIQSFWAFSVTTFTDLIVKGNVQTSGYFQGRNIEILGNHNCGSNVIARNYYVEGSSKIWEFLFCEQTVVVSEELKVRGNIKCRALFVRGNLEAKVIYSHGNDIFCGGTFKGILIGGGTVHEHFNEWGKLAEEIANQ